jgi:hypothetical protein
MPTLMSAITQPSATGITAHAASASDTETSGASRKMPLLEPDGITGSLRTNFSRSAKRLQQAPRANDVGAAAQLHGGPDLAVGIEDIGDEDQQRHQQHQRLRQDDGRAMT